MKKAIVIGINGQDGSYLSEWLVKNDYQVLGWVRPARLNSIDFLPKDNNKRQFWKTETNYIKKLKFLFSSYLQQLRERNRKHSLQNIFSNGNFIR